MKIVELDAPAVERRIDELAQLLLDAHAAGMALGLAAPLTREKAVAAYRAAADKLSSDRLLLVALDGEALVGAVQLDRAETDNGRHRAEVRRLVVRADRRGAGVGRALMEAVVARARQLGLRLLWLSTHDGSDADRIYARLGWTRSGVIPDYAELPSGELGANAFYFLQL